MPCSPRLLTADLVAEAATFLGRLSGMQSGDPATPTTFELHVVADALW